jgi:hypothetical protein
VKSSRHDLITAALMKCSAVPTCGQIGSVSEIKNENGQAGACHENRLPSGSGGHIVAPTVIYDGNERDGFNSRIAAATSWFGAGRK